MTRPDGPRTPAERAAGRADDDDLGLSLVDDDPGETAERRLLVGGVAGSGPADGEAVAAWVHDLSRDAVQVWASLQDGWAVLRLEGLAGALDRTERTLARHAWMQGVERLAVQALPDGASTGPSGWVHAGADGSTRGHLAACVRQVRRGVDGRRTGVVDAAAAWRRLCLPPLGEPVGEPAATGVAVPASHRPLLVLLPTPAEADAVAQAVVDRAGAPVRLRRITAGVVEGRRATGAAGGDARVIDRLGADGRRCPPVLVACGRHLPALLPLVLDAATVFVAPAAGADVDAPSPADRFVQSGVRPTFVGLARDLPWHRRRIREAGDRGLTYRVADLDAADAPAVARRVVAGWVDAAAG